MKVTSVNEQRIKRLRDFMKRVPKKSWGYDFAKRKIIDLKVIDALNNAGKATECMLRDPYTR